MVQINICLMVWLLNRLQGVEQVYLVASKYFLNFVFPNRATVNPLMLKPRHNLR